MSIKQNIVSALATVYDPEMPVNIIELGLIYNIALNDKHQALVIMTVP